MKRFEIKEFCGYEVIVSEEENSIYYELVTDEFYNSKYANNLRGEIQRQMDCHILGVLREAFQQMISAYYKPYSEEGLVAIIIPDNGESVVIRKNNK